MRSRLIAILLLTFALAPAVRAQSLNEDFLAAARKGDAAKVKELLDKGVDVNTKTQYGATALAYACDKGHIEVVKLLLEHGANVNVKDTFYGEVPIDWAISKDNVEIIKLLVDKGAQDKDRVLAYAVQKGQIDLVKAVLDKGEMKPAALSSPLELAITANKTEIVELLKQAGAVPKPNFPVDQETLTSYLGVYRHDAGDFTFTIKDGKLIASFRGRSYRLAAIDKTTFTMVELEGFTLKFNIEGDKVVSLTLTQPGFTGEFKRVDSK